MAEKKEMKKAATPKGNSDQKVPILIVDHNSRHTEDIIQMYQNHPDITYDITVKTDEEIRKLKSSDPKGNYIKQFWIIDQSGSRRKKNLNDESARHILDMVNPDQYVINRCFSAEVLAEYNGVEVSRLDNYQKGKQEIEIEQGDQDAKIAYIHKAHQWGIPVTENSDSKLELIASSKQEIGGKQTQIHEIFRSRKNPRHLGMQGHGEVGDRELMYGILNNINAERYKTKQYKKAA